jgi:hypothetical protein
MPYETHLDDRGFYMTTEAWARQERRRIRDEQRRKVCDQCGKQVRSAHRDPGTFYRRLETDEILCSKCMRDEERARGIVPVSGSVRARPHVRRAPRTWFWREY